MVKIFDVNVNISTNKCKIFLKLMK